MSVVIGALLGLAVLLAAVVLLLAIVATGATAARIGRDRRETRRLIRSVETALRQAANDRQEQP